VDRNDFQLLEILFRVEARVLPSVRDGFSNPSRSYKAQASGRGCCTSRRHRADHVAGFGPSSSMGTSAYSNTERLFQHSGHKGHQGQDKIFFFCVLSVLCVDFSSCRTSRRILIRPKLLPQQFPSTRSSSSFGSTDLHFDHEVARAGRPFARRGGERDAGARATRGSAGPELAFPAVRREAGRAVELTATSIFAPERRLGAPPPAPLTLAPSSPVALERGGCGPHADVDVEIAGLAGPSRAGRVPCPGNAGSGRRRPGRPEPPIVHRLGFASGT